MIRAVWRNLYCLLFINKDVNYPKFVHTGLELKNKLTVFRHYNANNFILKLNIRYERTLFIFCNFKLYKYALYSLYDI